MRRFRFYTERQKIRVGSSVKLPDFEAQHIRKSLRLKKGSQIFLFNGEKEFEAKLKLVAKDAVMAEVTGMYATVADKKISIDIFQGLSKAKSFEEILEKTTELGVNAIYPLLTEYSVIDIDKVDTKLDRWERIVISACKQSERISISEIHKPISVVESIELFKNYTHVLLLSPRDGDSVLTLIKTLEDAINETSLKLALIIGPEGGFSASEEKDYINSGIVQKIKISKTILRSETAAALAVGALRLLSI